MIREHILQRNKLREMLRIRHISKMRRIWIMPGMKGQLRGRLIGSSMISKWNKIKLILIIWNLIHKIILLQFHFPSHKLIKIRLSLNRLILRSKILQLFSKIHNQRPPLQLKIQIKNKIHSQTAIQIQLQSLQIQLQKLIVKVI